MAELISLFNARFPGQQPADELSAILADENTVTITTGQQLSLFGGPLYTIYKTISVIHLAKRLTRDTGRHVVPVFWLPDEDHDFEEIASVVLPEKQNLNRFSLPCDSCARHAAGSITIDEDFESFRKDVYQSLQPTDFSRRLTSLLDEAYTTGRTYRDAFGYLISLLFSDHGLILAGSNFSEAKNISRSCIEKAISNAGEIQAALEEQSRDLAENYHQQVQITDSLLFWHDDDHGRVRLKHENGIWHREPGVSYSNEELLSLSETQPERFSPNVFLRPIVQDTILPNAAYVGGPAEISYYGQMKPLYKFFDLGMPFIAARMSATLVEPAIQRAQDELPFEFHDYMKRFEELEQYYLRNYGDPEVDVHFEKWKQQLEELTEKMVEQIGITDPGLRKHSKALAKEQKKSIEKLKKKMLNAIRQKEEVQTNRIKKVKNALFPNDKLQEREISFIYYMNKFGLDLFDRILNQLSKQDEREPLFSRHFVIKL